MIFLDFDGVLFDTVREAYAVALITTGACGHVKEVDWASTHYKRFTECRYLVRSARDYACVLDVIGDEDVGNLRERLARCLQEAAPTLISSFEEAFFTAREHLREQERQAWLKLNRPFPFLRDACRLAAGTPESFWIVTTKDRLTVEELLAAHGAGVMAGNVAGREEFERHGGKRGVLESILRQYPAREALLVDDSRAHLEACRGISGLRLLQPEWGYVGPDDETVTREALVGEIEAVLRG